MARLAKTKARKTPVLQGSHPATTRAAVAIGELLKVREKLALLGKKRALLVRLIMDEGGCSAHGYRSYVSHVRSCTYTARKKEHDELKLIAIKGK